MAVAACALCGRGDVDELIMEVALQRVVPERNLMFLYLFMIIIVLLQCSNVLEAGPTEV